jgi:hypothetical protein
VQVVLHAVAAHAYGEQVVVTGVGQAPAPSQLAAAVAVPPEQLAARHDVVVDATAQEPPLAHSPVLPQGGALPQRASAMPARSVAQVPSPAPVLAFEQPMQVPVQALLQQTPSTQAPLAHWLAPVQAPPVLVTHVPPAHWAFAEQSALLRQVVEHPGPLQTNGAQTCGAGVKQDPLPSQIVAGCVTPLVQEAPAPQLVPRGATWQCAVPSQVPSSPQGGLAGHRASAPPLTIAAQVPSGWPVRALVHALQVPVQVLPQQTPSTHAPLVHS